MKSLTIIGCGKLGTRLGRLFCDRSVFLIHELVARHKDTSEKALSLIGGGKIASTISDLTHANVYLIATPDDTIQKCAEELAAARCLLPGDIVFHCSGALSSKTLFSVKDQGAFTASVHPLKSFSSEAESEDLSGTFCGIEGDEVAVSCLTAAFEKIGGKIFPLKSDKKIFYHAGSVIASNYIVALLEYALLTMEHAGIPRLESEKFLKPLVLESVEKVFSAGTEAALTGPISRGDSSTVTEELRAMKDISEDFGELYRLLGRIALKLTRERAELSSEQIARLESVLAPSPQT